MKTTCREVAGFYSIDVLSAALASLFLAVAYYGGWIGVGGQIIIKIE